MKVAFEKGILLEVVSPFWIDGEMVLAGDLIEVPTRDARDLQARKKTKTPDEKTLKKHQAAQ